MRLLFSFAGGEGHLQPLLAPARAAVARGHEVAVTGAASLGAVVEEGGLEFIPTAPDVEPYRLPLRPVDLERERRVVSDAYAGRIAQARAAELLSLCAAPAVARGRAARAAVHVTRGSRSNARLTARLSSTM